MPSSPPATPLCKHPPPPSHPGLVTAAVGLVRVLAALIQPYMPSLSTKLLAQLNLPPSAILLNDELIQAGTHTCTHTHTHCKHRIHVSSVYCSVSFHISPPLLPPSQVHSLHTSTPPQGSFSLHTLVPEGHVLGTPAPLVGMIPDELIEELRGR